MKQTTPDLQFCKAAFQEKMENEGLSKEVIDFFLTLYSKYFQGDSGKICSLTDISIVPDNSVIHIQSLPKKLTPDMQKKVLRKVAIIKLNGGLGTSMGLDKVKALLEVKNGVTYFDVIIAQVQTLQKKTGSLIPLIFMNSFNTDKDTLDFIRSKHPDFEKLNPTEISFIQNKYPKIDIQTKLPAQHCQKELEWNPPGHGDIFSCLFSSGLLDELIDKGYEYAFISNSDNLCATADPNILAYMLEHKIPFLMEVARRTEADKKGGHLALLNNEGVLVLREAAQCPEEEKDSFQDVNTWKYFNTNNIWLDLVALKEKLRAYNGFLPLDLILNPKRMNMHIKESLGNAEDNKSVMQIETAMGSAIRIFKGSVAVQIDSLVRFFPTKNISDLLILWSDACVLKKTGGLKYLPKNKIVVSLDNNYKYVEDLQFLTNDMKNIPSIKGVMKLIIKGKIQFRVPTVLKGNVSIINDSNTPLIINKSFLAKIGGENIVNKILIINRKKTLNILLTSFNHDGIIAKISDEVKHEKCS